MKLIAAILFYMLHGTPVEPLNVRHVVVAPAETLSVTSTGSGTPIVLIPGMLGGSFSFRKVSLELAARGDRVVIIDPLGTGGSSRPNHADYSMQAQATRVAAALDSLGITRALVVGHAAGAPIALRLALLRPEMVSGIVAVNGSASEQFSSGRMRMALKLAPVLKLFGAQQRARQHVIKGLRESSADASWVTADVITEYTAPYRNDFNTTLRVLKAVANSHEPWSLLSRLPQIQAPILLVLGTGSAKPNVKLEDVAAMRAALPSLRVDSIASAGAYVQEERPDLLVQAIRTLR